MNVNVRFAVFNEIKFDFCFRLVVRKNIIYFIIVSFTFLKFHKHVYQMKIMRVSTRKENIFISKSKTDDKKNKFEKKKKLFRKYFLNDKGPLRLYIPKAEKEN